MDLSDVPIVGRLVAALGVFADVALQGGETILWLVVLLVDGILGQPEIMVAILTTLNRLGDKITFLPAETIDTILTAALVAILILYVARWLNNLGNSTES